MKRTKQDVRGTYLKKKMAVCIIVFYDNKNQSNLKRYFSVPYIQVGNL